MPFGIDDVAIAAAAIAETAGEVGAAVGGAAAESAVIQAGMEAIGEGLTNGFPAAIETAGDVATNATEAIRDVLESTGTTPLTATMKNAVAKETGWSDELISFLNSVEEYEIYRDAGLQEVSIGDKLALIRDDIDWDAVFETFDEDGNFITETNADRIRDGFAPLDSNGRAIQLHHIGQHSDSPLAELTFKEHRQGGNDTILHNKSIETETHGPGNKWNTERETYWKARASFNDAGFGN